MGALFQPQPVSAQESGETNSEAPQPDGRDSVEQPLLADLIPDPSPYMFGERAKQQLGHRLPGVAKAHGLRTGELLDMFNGDDTLHVDSSGELLYFDLLAPGEPTPNLSEPSAATGAPWMEAPTNDAAFGLSSNPGAAKTIFLDFNGHRTEGTTWNSESGLAAIESPAYDIDGDPTSWSLAELDIIVRSWFVVAEDYAPWDINVTTVDPGPDALRRTSASDNNWGIRVVITEDTLVQCGCGGVAYIGAFDDVADEPAFVFNTNFTGVSEAITHEVGHTLMLAHDGSISTGYYRGHSTPGGAGWAPIMGSSYWEPVTHWSQQEFTGADNNTSDANFGLGADDIAIISSMTNGNNFGLKLDDHGDTAFAATDVGKLPATIDALITSRLDRDLFRFDTDGGQVDITATPALLGPNLDLAVTVFDDAGKIVTTADPIDSLGVSISQELGPGEYTIEVDGVGAGSPTAGSPTGYSDYGSIGTYSLHVSEPATDKPALLAHGPGNGDLRRCGGCE